MSIDLSKVPQALKDQIGKEVEFRSSVVGMTLERLTDQKFRFQTIGSIANVLNGNDRVIPMQVQQDAVSDWKVGKWQLTAFEEHPEGNVNGSMKDLAGICDIVELNAAGETIVNIRLLPTEEGEHVKLLFDADVKVGVSQRALGIQSVREDANGGYFIVVDKIVKILGYDFCLLESAAAGDRTQIRLLDTLEVDRIVNLKRIEDTFHKENTDMLKPEELQVIVDANARLVESVTALVDTIQAQMKGTQEVLPQEIVDTFATLTAGVEKLKADSAMDPTKKNSALGEIAKSLKAIVDTIVPPVVPPVVETPAVEVPAVEVPAVETPAVEPVVEAPVVETPAVETPAVETPVVDTVELTEAANRLRQAVEKQAGEKAAEVHATKMATYLTDKVAALTQSEDVRTQILDTLKTKSYENESLIDAAVDSMTKMLNLGVAQERMEKEGLKPKGTQVMDITMAPEHLKGIEIVSDQILGTGYLQSTKENLMTGKDRRPTVRQFLKIFDQMHGSKLKAEAEKIVALQDATTTPTDFQIPYTISRMVLEEVYSDYMIENLTDFGPMENKRDQIPLTVYRRETGLAGTKKTYHPTKARQNELKVGELAVMPKGKLTTSWFPIDATATKLQASFSDEFVTLSKRYSAITGTSRAISNLIADLKRSLQQMVFANMRNTAMSHGSAAFTYNGAGDGAKSVFTAVADASISAGEDLTVTVNAVTINEYEVSTTGTIFYVLDAPNGKVAFVDADGAPSVITNLHAIVVTGKKVTNEQRFSLTNGQVEWSIFMNGLLFKVQNQLAAHRQARGYQPDFILSSEVTANYMQQAQAYTPVGTKAGFTAANVAGEGNYGRTANLPHFGSAVWDDAFILISQRDATIFRIFEPLQLKGPYPVRNSDGALLGGEEYYAYQEDALTSPIAAKMSLVTLIP